MDDVSLAYEERIAHLRTGLEFAQEDIKLFKGMLGIEHPEESAIDMLLSEDINRSVEIDHLRANA